MIRNLVCDPLENSQKRTGNNSKEERTGKIIEVIWNHTEVLNELEKHTTFPGLSTYRRELASLENTTLFNKWKNASEINQLDLSCAFRDLERLAPVLLQLLKLLLFLSVSGKISQFVSFESIEGRFVLIFSILCFTRRRNTCNNIPRLLGLYFQSMGVKRRVLQVLAGLGICESYHTINYLNNGIIAEATTRLADVGTRSDTVIVYDNFD